MLDTSALPPIQLVFFILVIAFFYASIGFGGASGYLAAMSLFTIHPQVMASTALVLNLFASSIAFISFYRAQYFKPRLLWSFLLASIPAAFLGGLVQTTENTYLVLLYLSLTFVALRMLFFNSSSDERDLQMRSLPIPLALICGGIIGLLSGMIGIGGGIFLSPLIVLSRWGTPKQAAASAAGFIFINSLSGLLGRVVGKNLEVGLLGLALIPAGLLGAWIGGYVGARRLSGKGLRLILGLVLLIAVARFWLSQIAT